MAMRFKTSRCTERHGIAEIELVLSVLLLITVLMLLQGAMRLGVARLGTGQQAGFQAFHNATADVLPQYVTDPDSTPVVGYSDIRSGLPNRLHVPRPTAPVTVFTGDSQSTLSAQMEGAAALGGPFWIYTAYPVGGGDESMTRLWFEDYADESHTRYADSLGLVPPWAP